MLPSPMVDPHSQVWNGLHLTRTFYHAYLLMNPAHADTSATVHVKEFQCKDQDSFQHEVQSQSHEVDSHNQQPTSTRRYSHDVIPYGLR